MTNAQLGALTTAQRAAMSTANQFSTLSSSQLDVLNLAPTLASGSSSAVTVNEDSAVSTAVTLGLTNLTYSANESGQTLTYTIYSLGVPPEVNMVVKSVVVFLVCLSQSSEFKQLLHRRKA